MQKAFIIGLLFYGLTTGFFAQAQVGGSAVISANVPDVGQPKVAPNVAQDQTEVFELRYNAHSKADSVTSDLLMWIFLLFLLVIVTIAMLEVDEYRIHGKDKADLHSHK